METKLLRNKSLAIKVEKEEGSSERPIEIVEVDDSVTIKMEKEEDRPIDMVDVDSSLTIKFEEKDGKVEQECLFDVKNMTIANIEKMMEDLKNDNETLKQTLKKYRTNIIFKCKENDTTKAKIRELSKEKNELKAKCESLSSQVQDLEEDKALVMEQGRVQADLDLVTEIESLQRKLENSESNVNKLTQERDKINRQCQSKIESLQNKLEESESAKKLSHSTINNLMQERVRMNKLQTESQTKIKSLQNQFENCSIIIINLTEERDRLRIESQAEIESLHYKLETLSNEKLEKEEISGFLINKLTEERDQLKLECQMNIKEKNNVKGVIKHKNDRINLLDKEKDKLNTICREMEDELLDLRVENRDLEVELKWHKTELEKFSCAFLRLQNQNLKRKIDDKVSESPNPKKKKLTHQCEKRPKKRQAISWP